MATRLQMRNTRNIATLGAASFSWYRHDTPLLASMVRKRTRAKAKAMSITRMKTPVVSINCFVLALFFDELASFFPAAVSLLPVQERSR